MKRLWMVAFCLTVVGSLWARELTIDTTDSGSILISTSSLTPTLILSNNPAALRTYIVNPSSNVVFLSGMSTTSTSTPAPFSLSTSTGSYFLAVSTPNYVFSPDGPSDSFTGPMWAVSPGQNTTIQRIRMK